MLKYIRAHPVKRVTVAGGVAKMTKLAQGMLDVHSKRGAPDLEALAEVAVAGGGDAALAEAIRGANTVAKLSDAAEAEGIAIGNAVARGAWATAAAALSHPEIELEILVFRPRRRAARPGALPTHSWRVAAPEAALIERVVERAFARAIGGEAAPDEDDGGALDRGPAREDRQWSRACR